MRMRLLALLLALLTLSVAACSDSDDNEQQANYSNHDRFSIDREAYCEDVDFPTQSEIAVMADDSIVTSDQFGCSLDELTSEWHSYTDAADALEDAEWLGYTPVQVLKLEGMTKSPKASTCGFVCLDVLEERRMRGDKYTLDELASVLDATAFSKDVDVEFHMVFTSYDIYRDLGLDQAEAIDRLRWLDDEVSIEQYHWASVHYYWAVTRATNGENDSLALYVIDIALTSNELGYPGTRGEPDEVQWLVDKGYPIHEALYIVNHEEIEANLDNPLLTPADRQAFVALIG